jgi:F0F1-type ATP synthase delta subunit
MNSKLFSHIRTTDERDTLLDEIGTLLSSLYQEKGRGLDSCLKNKVRFWVSEIVRREIGSDLETAEKYLTGLKETLEGLGILKLTLAFEPTDISIDKFTEFVRRNMGEDIVVEFEYDARILGGALITYNGEFRDFSLKRLFEEEYKQKQPEVMKIMYTRTV